jgi:hypothetical protein
VGNEAYFHRHMQDSPEGREIRRLDGDAAAITARGEDIASLGDRMKRAAETLRLIADEQVGEGESLKAVREQAVDVHADLKTAGERYAPSGAALKYYGGRLADIQPRLNQAVTDAEAAWETVRSRAGAVDDAGDVPEDDGGGTTARDQATQTAETGLTQARSAWLVHAQAFDREYDSWSSAYEYTRSRLEQANEDGVSDGFWDDAMPFIEGLVTVLEWAAVVLVIAALVIGGPLIGVIAAVVAVIALLGTIVLALNGRKGWQDVALAALGVIPFGKLGKLLNLTDLAAAGARFPRLSGFRNLFFGADDIRSLSTHFSRIDARASAAWNFTSNGLPFSQITGGSRFIQRVISGAPYVWENMPTVLPRSREMFIARFAGYGDSLAGAHSFGLRMPLLTTIQGGVQTVSLADFANSAVQDAAVEARVDSWR